MSTHTRTYGETTTAPCRQVDSEQARQMMNDNDALLIDVREPHELTTGRIPEATAIPLRQIAARVDELRQHETRPIILSCRSGRRSEMVCRYLRESGIDNVYNLSGGIIAWARANPGMTQ